jgi:hypothetical protein
MGFLGLDIEQMKRPQLESNFSNTFLENSSSFVVVDRAFAQDALILGEGLWNATSSA